MKQIWGVVGVMGNIVDPGSGGWTSTQTGNGNYLVTFDGPVDPAPTVLLTGNSPAALTVVFNRTQASFSVQITDHGGAQLDASFSFLAIAN